MTRLVEFLEEQKLNLCDEERKEANRDEEKNVLMEGNRLLGREAEHEEGILSLPCCTRDWTGVLARSGLVDCGVRPWLFLVIT